MTSTRANALLAWTWPKLIRIEPELATLERLALGYYSRDYPSKADWIVLVGMLRELAGETALRPELRAREPFEVAREHLERCWKTGETEDE